MRPAPRRARRPAASRPAPRRRRGRRRRRPTAAVAATPPSRRRPARARAVRPGLVPAPAGRCARVPASCWPCSRSRRSSARASSCSTASPTPTLPGGRASSASRSARPATGSPTYGWNVTEVRQKNDTQPLDVVFKTDAERRASSPRASPSCSTCPMDPTPSVLPPHRRAAAWTRPWPRWPTLDLKLVVPGQQFSETAPGQHRPGLHGRPASRCPRGRRSTRAARSTSSSRPAPSRGPSPQLGGPAAGPGRAGPQGASASCRRSGAGRVHRRGRRRAGGRAATRRRAPQVPRDSTVDLPGLEGPGPRDRARTCT